MENNALNVLKEYDIEQIKEILKLEKGIENNNYLITTKTKRFVLREYRDSKTKEEIIYEISFMKHLLKNRFPVPDIITNKYNKQITELNDFYVLFSYMDGKEISKNEATKEQIAEIASMLAEMHLVSTTFKAEGKNESQNIFEFIKYIELPKNLNYLKKQASNIKKILNYKLYKSLKKGTVHSDFNDENIKFKGNKITAILDFDDCKGDAFISDIALTLLHWGITNHKPNKDIFKLFIKNYTKIRAVHQKELDLIIPLIKAHLIYNILHSFNLYQVSKKKKLLGYYKVFIKKLKNLENFQQNEYNLFA